MISVIVPVFNIKPFLPACLESVLGQTYSELQVILVDDGSNDGSGEVCDRYAEGDERIIVIHQENKGLSPARNTGLDMAEGDFICFVDGDDWIHRQMLEHLVAVMENDKEIDMVCCGNRRVSSEKTDDEEMYFGFPDIEVSVGKDVMGKYLHDISGYWPMSCAKLYRTSLFVSQRFPLGKIHEDEFVTYKLLWNSRKVAYTDCAYYNYRQRTGSIMQTESIKGRLDAIEAYIERNRWLRVRGFDEKECEWDSAVSFHALKRLKKSAEKLSKDENKRMRQLFRTWYRSNKETLSIKESIAGIQYYVF